MGSSRTSLTSPASRRRALALLFVAILCLAGRTLAFCPNGCNCDDETLQVSCDEVNLEVIPITFNPSVQRLVLRHNKIKNIDTALRFYVELLYIDFSNNMLVVIQNKSFEAQRKLTELRLDHNKISVISNGTWIGLSRELAILSLRKNFISSLDERTFGTAASIRELDLGQNRIEQIHPDAFAGLPNLRILYLDNNKLSYNTPNLPAFLGPLRPLAELSLSGNDLPWLADGLLTATAELSQLDLSGCGIRNISADAFRGVPQLRGLKLNDNLLAHVPTHAWHALAHLETIDLGQNNMSTIGPKAFAGLSRLKQIDIGDAAQLMSIDSEAFSANRELSVIKLTNCRRLTTLPEGLIMHLVNLRRLVLRDNGLTVLPDKVFLNGPNQLQQLDLGGNPFHCDCRMTWLRDYLVSGAVKTIGPATVNQRMRRQAPFQDPLPVQPNLEPVCASPLPVADRPLQMLSDDQLGCRTAFFSSPPSLVIVLLAGVGVCLLSAAALACRFRRRIRQRCCGTSKPHPVGKSEDARTLSTKWKPASPNSSWGINASAGLSGLGSHGVSFIGGRAPEYQKACSTEEECFMRAVTLHNTLKPFPRTEL